MATKTGERTYRGAREEIRRSLDRLGVDRVDSIQLHNLVDVIEWETALGADGALEAAIEAREEGLVRFIGVTGHGLSVAGDAPAQPRALPVRLGPAARTTTCRCRIRATRRRSRRWPRSAPSATSRCRRSRASPRGAGTAARRPPPTWYEPLREQADIDLAAHWVLGRPEAFLLTAGDVEILPRLLDAAERFERRPSDEQMAELAAPARAGAAVRLSRAAGGHHQR